MPSAMLMLMPVCTAGGATALEGQAKGDAPPSPGPSSAGKHPSRHSCCLQRSAVEILSATVLPVTVGPMREFFRNYRCCAHCLVTLVCVPAPTSHIPLPSHPA